MSHGEDALGGMKAGAKNSMTRFGVTTRTTLQLNADQRTTILEATFYNQESALY